MASETRDDGGARFAHDLGNDLALVDDGGDLWLNFDNGAGLGLVMSCEDTLDARLVDARRLFAEALERIDALLAARKEKP